MLIEGATRLLGMVDCRALTQRVLDLEESVWLANPQRQQQFDVHAQTQSIVLVFCEGWPAVRILKYAGWEHLGREATPVMDEVIGKHYPTGGVILRAMVARLPAGCRIHRHRDAHPSFSVAHRIHVPLVTNPEVEFLVDKERIAVQEGVAFEINNLLAHQVTNNGTTARIHFIFDYAPQRD